MEQPQKEKVSCDTSTFLKLIKSLRNSYHTKPEPCTQAVSGKRETAWEPLLTYVHGIV